MFLEFSRVCLICLSFVCVLVSCSVTWPLNGSEAACDLVLMKTTAFVA